MLSFRPLLSAVAALALVLPALPAQVATAPQAVTLIRGARVFDGLRALGTRDVLLRDGRIAEVATRIRAPRGATIVEAKGQTLLPGLIDAHTHVWEGSLETALAFGVTTELDMFSDTAAAARYRREQRGAGIATRADMYSAGTLVTTPGGHGTQFGMPIPTLTDPTQAQAFIDARIAEGSDYIKIVYDRGDTYGLQWSTLSRDALAAAIRAAQARGKLAVVHVGDLAGAKDAVAAGADGLVHLFVDRAPDSAFVRLAAERQVFVIPTLTVLQSIAAVRGGVAILEDAQLAPYLGRMERTMLAQTFPPRTGSGVSYAYAEATVRALRAAGVRVLAGTDAANPGTAHGASMHGELALLVAAGMTPAEALVAATSGPADAFRLGDRGRIAVGRRADLLLVDGDPLQDITATRRIAGIWKGGQRFDREVVAAAVRAADAAAAAAVATGASGLVSDFDDGTMRTGFGAGWMLSDDKMAGGASSATMDVVPGGANGSAQALRIAGSIADKVPYAWAGAMFSPGAAAMTPADLSAKREIRFWAKGDGGTYRLMLFVESKGFTPVARNFTVTADWQEFVMPFADFNTDGKGLMSVLFVGGPKPGAFELLIDDVRIR